jgi:hypothetical protein
VNQPNNKPLANPRLRETFERRAREQGHQDLSHKADGTYSNIYLEAAWSGYQMHDADHQQQLQGGERIEVIAYLTAGFRDHLDKSMNRPTRSIMDALPSTTANENREESTITIRDSEYWMAENSWERAVVDELMTVAQHKRILANYKTPEYVLPFEITTVELRQLQETWACIQTRCGRLSTNDELNELVHKGLLINRGFGRYGVTELGHFFLRNAVRDEIPSGIYYSLEHDNFYSKFGRQGQGNYFYRQWIDRKGEFPRSADE